MYREKIRVLVVDDSLLFRKVLSTELSKDSMIEVVATASDAYEARDKIIEYVPDVITLDINMPKMDGIEFTRKLMAQYPLPIVIVSSHAETKSAAFNSGAVYFLNKPDINSSNSLASFIDSLTMKIKLASKRKQNDDVEDSYTSVEKPQYKDEFDYSRYVAIGASTGGVDALNVVLMNLPENFPGIVVTQHIPPKFSTMLAERLDKSCALKVVEAVDGEKVEAGKVIIAPGDQHMRVVKSGTSYTVRLSNDEKVNGHRPSVDILFDSVANTIKDKAVGVILTGMGKDGAKGLLNMHEMGSYTIGQDKETSVVYGMPMEAYNIGAVSKQLALENIPKHLINILKK